MVCCKEGCSSIAVYLGRCPDHAIEYRRKHPREARKHDEAMTRAEKAAANVYGKELLARLKEARNGQGQDT